MYITATGKEINDDPVKLTPHEFLQVMFSGVTEGWCEVCYLAPDGIKLYPHEMVQWAALPLGEINPELPVIHDMNRKGYSCYFAPAVRNQKYEPQERISAKSGRPYTFYPRGKAVDALYITALWVDIDEPGDAGYLRTIGAIVPPSIVVSSGGGWHGYWLLNKPLPITDYNRKDVKQTLKGMALACGGDTKVADLARIMRLPGTVNTKPNRGNLCEAIDYIPVRYDYMDFELAYSPLAAPKIPPVRRSLPIEGKTPFSRYVEDYLVHGESEGNRNQRAYTVARWLLDNGYTFGDVETLVGNRARADGLLDEEIDRTLNSALRADRSQPDLPSHMQTRMGVADKRLTGNNHDRN